MPLPLALSYNVFPDDQCDSKTRTHTELYGNSIFIARVQMIFATNSVQCFGHGTRKKTNALNSMIQALYSCHLPTLYGRCNVTQEFHVMENNKNGHPAKRLRSIPTGRCFVCGGSFISLGRRFHSHSSSRATWSGRFVALSTRFAFLSGTFDGYRSGDMNGYVKRLLQESHKLR